MVDPRLSEVIIAQATTSTSSHAGFLLLSSSSGGGGGQFFFVKNPITYYHLKSTIMMTLLSSTGLSDPRCCPTAPSVGCIRAPRFVPSFGGCVRGPNILRGALLRIFCHRRDVCHRNFRRRQVCGWDTALQHDCLHRFAAGGSGKAAAGRSLAQPPAAASAT